MPDNRWRSFWGAFAVTLIAIGALCGFMVVDLSTDRYMPGQAAPIYAVSEIDADGAQIALMGETYTIESGSLWQGMEVADELRGLLPIPAQFARILAQAAAEAAQEEVEEPENAEVLVPAE